jgi:alcohol dehydrogenase, propanol-preferring
MQAVILAGAGQQLSVRSVPEPEVGPDDLLLRVEACGVCHSDLHLADGLLEPFGLSPFPIVLGHEVAGVVERTGSRGSEFAPGDRVGVAFHWACGRCRYCLAGAEESCQTLFSAPRAAGMSRPGGYAERMVAPAAFVLPLPPELSFVAAAPLMCGGLTVYAALKRAGVRAGQRVAVLGIGGLGHLALQIARAMGADVVAITASESKAPLARNLGARHVIIGSCDTGQQLAALGGAEVILSTTTDVAAITAVMPGLLPRGTLALTGFATEPVPVVPMALAFGSQRVQGSLIGSRRDLQELLALAVQHEICALTETYRLDEAQAVHDRLRANAVRLRAVLLPAQR